MKQLFPIVLLFTLLISCNARTSKAISSKTTFSNTTEAKDSSANESFTLIDTTVHVKADTTAASVYIPAEIVNSTKDSVFTIGEITNPAHSVKLFYNPYKKLLQASVYTKQKEFTVKQLQYQRQQINTQVKQQTTASAQQKQVDKKKDGGQKVWNRAYLYIFFFFIAVLLATFIYFKIK